MILLKQNFEGYHSKIEIKITIVYLEHVVGIHGLNKEHGTRGVSMENSAYGKH